MACIVADRLFRVLCILVPLLAGGCIRPRAEVRDPLEARALPVPDRSRLTDAMVRPAVAERPRDADQALPAALDPSPAALPRPIEAASPDFPVTDGPPEATSQPLSLPEAIGLAYRLQPRLRAQLESIAQARGREQIAFSTFLPTVAGNYDVGGFTLGVGGEPIGVGRGTQNFNFIPFLGSVPVGLNIQSGYELAELKVQWLLLDFGRRLGRYDQAKLAKDVAQLQTDRAFQTVANEVSVAYYGVLRAKALRRTFEDAARRADMQLADARKLLGEGVVERETVLRAEVLRAETRQQLHAAVESEYVALAELDLAIGLKCNQPVGVVEPPAIPTFDRSLADCLQTAVRERREFHVAQRAVEIARQGSRVARADFAPKVIADGTLLDFRQASPTGAVDLAVGFIRLDWTLFEGGRRIAEARVADSRVREAMAQAESIVDNIAFQVNEAYRRMVTARLGIEDARPAVEQARENFRLVRSRALEGDATPTEISDAQASLTRAEQSYLNAVYNYLTARTRLEYAMGAGQTPATAAHGLPPSV
ncbi:MAG: TolC family protein [Paludisphaera borealis]|uniref:TolC family protein n=1 Tax=Paludisphaera borealis TaxID=1387353 RepID=UPI00283C6874|nr:TolC family protein [Paludisphaera borealis]MDR3618755.1 TolC family protein [Paludisphaera borealis]